MYFDVLIPYVPYSREGWTVYTVSVYMYDTVITTVALALLYHNLLHVYTRNVDFIESTYLKYISRTTVSSVRSGTVNDILIWPRELIMSKRFNVSTQHTIS